jgi:hypothetical protein
VSSVRLRPYTDLAPSRSIGAAIGALKLHDRRNMLIAETVADPAHGADLRSTSDRAADRRQR